MWVISIVHQNAKCLAVFATSRECFWNRFTGARGSHERRAWEANSRQETFLCRGNKRRRLHYVIHYQGHVTVESPGHQHWCGTRRILANSLRFYFVSVALVTQNSFSDLPRGLGAGGKRSKDRAFGRDHCKNGALPRQTKGRHSRLRSQPSKMAEFGNETAVLHSTAIAVSLLAKALPTLKARRNSQSLILSLSPCSWHNSLVVSV